MATPPDPAIPFRPHHYWLAGTSVVGLEGEDQPDVWAHKDKRAYRVRRFTYSTIGVRTDFMGDGYDVAFTTGRFSQCRICSPS